MVSSALLMIRLRLESICASMTPCTPVTQTYPFSPCVTAVSRRARARSMLVAWTLTPRIFTQLSAEGFDMAFFRSRHELVAVDAGQLAHFLLLQFALNPLVGNGKALLQRSIGFPAKHLAKQSVVAIAPAPALRSVELMPLLQVLAGDAADHVDQMVDADHLVGPQVQRLAMVRRHQTDQAFHAVVHVHVRAGLLAIAPDLDRAVSGRRDFTRDRRRRLFLAAVVGAQRAVDVVEAHNARLELIVVVVVSAKLFGKQFFPPVAWLGVSRIRILFLQRNEVGSLLFVLRVHAGGRREKETLHTVLLAGFEHVRVDQNVVFRNIGQERRDVADAAHICSEVIDLVHALCGSQAVFPHAQVQNLKVVGSRGFVLGMLNIDPAYPVAILLQTLDEVMTNESTRPSYQNPSLFCHCFYSPSLFFG